MVDAHCPFHYLVEEQVLSMNGSAIAVAASSLSMPSPLSMSSSLPASMTFSVPSAMSSIVNIAFSPVLAHPCSATHQVVKESSSLHHVSTLSSDTINDNDPSSDTTTVSPPPPPLPPKLHSGVTQSKVVVSIQDPEGRPLEWPEDAKHEVGLVTKETEVPDQSKSENSQKGSERGSFDCVMLGTDSFEDVLLKPEDDTATQILPTDPQSSLIQEIISEDQVLAQLNNASIETKTANSIVSSTSSVEGASQLDMVEFNQKTVPSLASVSVAATVAQLPAAALTTATAQQASMAGRRPRCGRSCSLCVHMIDDQKLTSIISDDGQKVTTVNTTMPITAPRKSMMKTMMATNPTRVMDNLSLDDANFDASFSQRSPGR